MSEEIPQKAEKAGILYPTHPGGDNSRYRSSKRSQYTCLAVQAGAHLSPTYLPSQWSAHIQPEGKTYFYYDGPLATVTESWMHTPEAVAEAEKWIRHISSEIIRKEIALTGLELCVQIDEDNDCLYYIVDKRNRTLFWLQDYDNESLGLPRAVSSSHLAIELEGQFWLHTDRFPAHFGGLPEADLLKALDVYAHARMDQVTSTTWAFSYSAEDTRTFYDLLNGCRGRTSEPEVVSTIARAWHLIMHNRFYNQYGEETPRLDSKMSIIDGEMEEKEGFSIRVMALLTFGKSEKYRVCLNELYVDNYVRHHRIHDLIEQATKEWREIPIHAFSMLFLHGVFFFAIASQLVAAISAGCLSASLLTSFALIQQLDGQKDHRNSPLTSDWISERASQTHKFQKLGFVFALPTAFFNWGLIFFFSHWLWIAFLWFNTSVAATFIGIIALACFALISVTFPQRLHFRPPSFLRIFRKERTTDSDKSLV